MRPAQQRDHPRAIDRHFRGRHPHDEILVRKGRVLVHRLAEGDQVERLDVVLVPLVDGLRERPTLGVLAQAQEVAGEARLRGQVIGVGGQGLPLIGGTLGEAVLGGQLLADERVDAGVARPGGEGLARANCSATGSCRRCASTAR